MRSSLSKKRAPAILARYGDLGLADPGATDGGKEVTLSTSGGVLTDLIVVGNRDTTVGGATAACLSASRVSRKPTSRAAACGCRRLRSEWFVPVDFDVKRDEIKKIELAGGGRDTITVTAEKPGDFKLADVPEKRSEDQFKVSRLATLVDSFTFQDVRKARKGRRRRAAYDGRGR